MTTIREAVQIMSDAGIRQIDIYYAELINDGETDWSVDVMCDPINDMCESSWTWTITSIEEFIKVIEEDEFYISEDWVVITNRSFSEDTVRESIYEWMLANELEMQVRVIDVEDAAGSGYVRELRKIDLEELEQNAVPLDEME